jgi:dienelactone hydrolase
VERKSHKYGALRRIHRLMSTNAHIFDYDAKRPLDIQDRIIGESEHAIVHDISYAGAGGARVAAYLVLPKGSDSFAGILFGHWGSGTRAQFVSEAKLYARAGAVSLIPDYPWERTEPWRRTINHFDKPEIDRETYIQTVIDFRRGLDLLLTRPQVDPRRMAYVGHSYGAQWGAILGAIDKRFKTLVLMAGIAEIADHLMGNTNLDTVELRKTQPAGQWERYVEVLGDLDAIHFINRRSSAPLLLQFACYEQYFDKASARRYIEAAENPKKVIWYETDHGLSAVQSFEDRHRWLREFIGLRVSRP